jgi:hypothetical protein
VKEGEKGVKERLRLTQWVKIPSLEGFGVGFTM